jgi:hypothetical protein
MPGGFYRSLQFCRLLLLRPCHAPASPSRALASQFFIYRCTHLQANVPRSEVSAHQVQAHKLSVTCVDGFRYVSSGELPSVGTHERDVIVCIGWMGCKEKHLDSVNPRFHGILFHFSPKNSCSGCPSLALAFAISFSHQVQTIATGRALATQRLAHSGEDRRFAASWLPCRCSRLLNWRVPLRLNDAEFCARCSFQSLPCFGLCLRLCGRHGRDRRWNGERIVQATKYSSDCEVINFDVS